ncbi:AMP-binding protein [Bowmanella sp. JS7-9]|uniref:AMP-binding protein n=1 Tax=Pseudobowmanella zhangzhouensis TaxID=1537679 RepID=A0ABW1XGI0_9ALTE|nr:AMP-binding protein [Bowmanella sp. JS7-9]
MFFNQLTNFAQRVALISDDETLTYAQLQDRVNHWLTGLPTQRQLVFVQMQNSVADISFYLALLQGGHVAMLLAPELDDDKLSALQQTYQPNLVYRAGHVQQVSDQYHELAPELMVLMSTSGSTGSAKQVALSGQNLHSNAVAIAGSLPMQADDIALTTLAPHYVYGLSVINSHLAHGATLRLFNASVMSREFWQLLEHDNITSFAGVPYTYNMLIKLGFLRKDWPSLSYYTQAGGKLAAEQVTQLAEYADEHGQEFIVMYGQTEATARMAVNRTPMAKPTSIGRAIANGEFQLRDDAGQPINACDQQGELYYRGPNVALGYASCITDLARFSPPEWLATGDMARRDEDGDYYIVGRKKRFIKPFGQRINLQDVEDYLASAGIQACATGNDEYLQVAVLSGDAIQIQTRLQHFLGLHPRHIQVRQFAELPLSSNGKPDYPAIARSFND